MKNVIVIFACLGWLSAIGSALAQTATNSTNPTVVIGGFDSDIAITPTVAASAHVQGKSVGGLQTVSLLRSLAQPSAVINQVAYYNMAGSTVAMTLYAFDTLPTGNGFSCADNTAFVLDTSNTTPNIAKLIPGFPIILTPAVPDTGITQSVAFAPITASVKNQDGSATTNVYFCLVARASITPAVGDVILKFSAILD